MSEIRQRKASDHNKATVAPNASTSAKETKPAVEPEVTRPFCFHVIRVVLILALFIGMHLLFNKYVLDPWAHGAAIPSPEDQIMRNLCPPGAECSFH
jgi:hypothetical protein